MSPRRSDRTPGNRGAYEAARMKILRTQTVCGICGKPVDFSYKNPHPLSPTVARRESCAAKRALSPAKAATLDNPNLDIII